MVEEVVAAIKVDPRLAGAAQRITAALAQLPAGQDVHPALGADFASLGGAARLTAAGSTLAALIGAQAAGLVATAEVLAGIGAGIDAIEAANQRNLAGLRGSAALAPSTGLAPPAVQAPDVRPPMPPPAAVTDGGGDLARGAHRRSVRGPGLHHRLVGGGRRARGRGVRGFAGGAESARDLGQPGGDTCGAGSAAEVSERVGRFGVAGSGLAQQADRHAGDVIHARQQIPPPQKFDELNQQIRQTWEANRATDGKYGPALVALYARRTELDTEAVQGFDNHYVTADNTTSPWG